MMLNNKAVSMVFATLLALIIIISVCVAEFQILKNLNTSMDEQITFEQEQLQERIQVFKLNHDIDDGVDCIDQITVRNTGSITIAIKSIYVDNEFLFDASNITINPLGNIISPNSTKAISFQGIANENKTYQPNSTITVVTDRGTRSIALQQTLASYTDSQLIVQTNFGPLKLDFNEFYYATYDSGVVGSWQPGWSISKTLNKGVIWKVNVTNICNTAISLKNNTCFFLMAVSPANLREWYLNSTSTISLDPGQAQTLTFIWKTPNGGGVNSIFSTACTCRVLMAFFGTYETEKPLAQTIPFQSVSVY